MKNSSLIGKLVISVIKVLGLFAVLYISSRETFVLSWGPLPSSAPYYVLFVICLLSFIQEIRAYLEYPESQIAKWLSLVCTAISVSSAMLIPKMVYLESRFVDSVTTRFGITVTRNWSKQELGDRLLNLASRQKVSIDLDSYKSIVNASSSMSDIESKLAAHIDLLQSIPIESVGVDYVMLISATIFGFVALLTLAGVVWSLKGNVQPDPATTEALKTISDRLTTIETGVADLFDQIGEREVFTRDFNNRSMLRLGALLSLITSICKHFDVAEGTLTLLNLDEQELQLDQKLADAIKLLKESEADSE